MKRADLIRSIQVQFKRMDERDAMALTDEILGYLKKSIAEGHRVELRGLGVFQPRLHMTKIGFNPKTCQRIAISARRTVKFRPSSSIVKEISDEGIY